MRIAVLGGAFDPIHNGHLQIAKQALKQLRVDEVWFMPSAATPLKQTQAASFSDRAAMVALAIRPYRHMKLCTLEHELEGVSYSIRTVKELKKRYPKHSFCWLIGDDQARQFDRWKDSEDLKQQLPFYVFSREQHTEQLPAGLQRVVMQLIPVSSSEIRKGHKLYQVPEAVRAYMGLHALYLESMVKEQMNEHRYLHSQSVAQLCVELAQAHGLDTRAAYIMGIAHDVCKQLPYEKAKAWMRAHMPDHLEEAAAIWHGYIGADYVNKVFHIRDRRILQAIYHHVKGRNRTYFDRILFIADKLDPSRGYDSRREIEISRKSLREGYRVVKQQQEAYLRKEGTLK